MSLTTAQLQTLGAYIASVPAWAALPNIADVGYEIAAALDVPSEPPVIVWKTNVSADEIMRNGMDWARVDNLTAGKARIWDWMTRLGSFNAGKINVRAGIDATWVGTAADLAVRAQVYTHCKRTATKAEVLFATGAGTDASPSTMEFEGALNYNDVLRARAS